MNYNVKKVFPGGNTTKGFYSYYHYINQPNPVKNYILKGGPGVGKSNFMKDISKEMLKRGYTVELHYCSSSNGSLDAVVIDQLKIAVIDGTAPHLIDPSNPGAVDEIINLGEYWDETALKKNKAQIVQLNSEVGKYFRRAFRYLKALDESIKNIAEVYNGGLNNYRYCQLQDTLIENVFAGVEKKDRIGYDKHFFGSAITPDGVVDYLETVVGVMDNIYYIKGGWGTRWSELLDEIRKRAIRLGLDVEVYHTPFAPEMIEDIVIPEINLALTTKDKFIDKCSSVIDLELLIDKDVVDKYKSEVESDQELFTKLLDKAVESINKAKLLHDELEGFYISSMYFDSVDKKRNDILNRILKYESQL